MDTRHSANKSANVTGVNDVLLGVFPQKTRGSPGRKRDVGSIPITRSILFHPADLQECFVHHKVVLIAPCELLFTADDFG